MSLEFDEPTHTYRWNGKVVPSVTQVLENVKIIDYDFIPHDTREMALERGRLVHQATHFDDEGDLDEATLDPMLAGYVAAARNWQRDSGFQVEADDAGKRFIEYRGFQEKFGYAGTLDRRGTIGVNGKRFATVADYKTNDAPYWTAYQLAGYCAFFDSPRTFTRLAVELHADGSYKVYEFDGKTWQQDFSVFLAALTVWKVKDEHNRTSNRRRAS